MVALSIAWESFRRNRSYFVVKSINKPIETRLYGLNRKNRETKKAAALLLSHPSQVEKTHIKAFYSQRSAFPANARRDRGSRRPARRRYD